MKDGTCIAIDFSHYLAFAALQFLATDVPPTATDAVDSEARETCRQVMGERGGRYIAGVLDSAGVDSEAKLSGEVVSRIIERAACRAASSDAARG
jgi:hypothetical protein